MAQPPQPGTVRPAPKTAAALLGYEPALLAALRPAERQHLDALAHAWAVSCILLGVPAGHAVWSVEHSAWLAVAVGAGTCALVGNLLRLLVAGGGVAADRPWQEGYRPPRAPGLMIGALALMLAQPALLMLDGARTDAAARTHRAQLLTAHRQALADMGRAEAAAGHDAFAQQTARCEFVVLRLKTLWDVPQRTALGTALYALLVLAPFLLGRSLWLGAVLAYERARYARATAQRHAALIVTERAVRTALSMWPGYRGGASMPGPGARP